MMQIGNFIRGRGSSYKEVERLLEESTQSLYIRAGPPAEYGHTVFSVWEPSLRKLSPEATALLNMLSFFGPHEISEELVTNKDAGLRGTQLGFLLDRFE